MPFTATERTSPPIPLVELLAATKARVMGELDPDTEFRWIERNSREVTPGDLFIAVKGRPMMGMPSSTMPPGTAPEPRWFGRIGPKRIRKLRCP